MANLRAKTPNISRAQTRGQSSMPIERSLEAGLDSPIMYAHPHGATIEVDTGGRVPVTHGSMKGPSEMGQDDSSTSEPFNQAALIKRLDEMEANLRKEIASDVLKILAEQQHLKAGRDLKEDFPEEASKNVGVSLTLPPKLANSLNKRINQLKKEGKIKSRDAYFASLITNDLDIK